jgi:glycosyltransferase involved in cell wall biosynthesis
VAALLSVLTVTYNASNELPGLIESLRAQTDQSFEWVVMDGASTDGSQALISAAGDVVSHWLSEPDFGIYDALNKAIRYATCDFYLVCGADDRLAPDAIANFRETLNREPDADLVCASVEADSRIISPFRGQPWRWGHLAFVSQHAVGTLIRKNLHQQFGFYSLRFPIAADQYFLKKACLSPNTKLICGEFVAGHYAVGGVSSSDFPGTMSEYFRVQLETERFPALQLLLYLFRLLRYSNRVLAWGKTRRRHLLP